MILPLGMPGEKGEPGSPGTGVRGQRGATGPPGETVSLYPSAKRSFTAESLISSV